jgi:plastocyanin
VDLEDSTFVPPGGEAVDGVPALTIPVGTTVTWTNVDLIDHTATEYLNGFTKPDARFDLELAPEASGSYTFDEAGTYEVGCVPHPAMQMLVIVE